LGAVNKKANWLCNPGQSAFPDVKLFASLI